MLKSILFKKSVMGLVVLSLSAGLLLATAPTSAVSAAAPAQTPTQTPNNGGGGAQSSAPVDAQARGIARLEKLYQAELKTLDRQGKWVDRTEKIIAWVNKAIDRFLGKGKNVDPLRAALDKFKAGVDQSKAKHDSAAAILALHKGFGEDGKVTDRALALDTVKTAGQDLREAARTYRQAFVALRKSVLQFIRDNRP